jgi:hypothetical protein
MIAPSLYADLTARGVKLSIAPTPGKESEAELPPLHLQVRAPEGALNDALRSALTAHRDELIQFVFELEEAAAILQIMQGNRIEESQVMARECVRGGTASPDGGLWLHEYATRHPQVIAAQHACRKILDCELEIVDVRRVA